MTVRVARFGWALVAWAALGLLACGDRAASRAEPAAEAPRAVEAPVTPAAPRPPVAAAAPLAFVEQVTGGADPAKPLPLIIAVHGLGDRPENFVRLFDGLPFPARIVAPRGPNTHGRGHSWFPVKIPVDEADPAMVAGLSGSADRLAALADWLVAKRPTVGRPVITGFSQGGMLSFAVAVRHPDAVSGAVPLAGALPASLWSGPGPKAPVIALHGADDRVVPFARDEALVAALSGRGAAARLRGFEGVGHRVSPEMRRALFEALAELAPSAR